MQRRYARTLQRLALIAGMCAGAWLAAEGLDHGTARADDVPIRVETEQPGGLLDQTSDTTEAPPEPPADPTPAPGETGPEQTEEPDHPLPADAAVGAVDAPDPADGDDGSPQHPVDTPPDPGPTDTSDQDPEPEPAGDTSEGEVPATEVPPADPTNEDRPPLGGDHTPAPYVPVDDVQPEPSNGRDCDSRGATPAAPRPGTRDRLASPRGLAGPEPTPPPWGNPCDPDPLTTAGGQMPGHFPIGGDQTAFSSAVIPRGWVPDLYRAVVGHDRRDNDLPLSRLTLWPPGPG